MSTLPDGGPVFVELDRRGIDIGRDSYLDWTLPDPERFISGKHCEIRYEDGGFWVHDVSTNGTLINNATSRLPAPHKLQHGDRIHIGSYILVAELSGEEAGDSEGPREIPNRGGTHFSGNPWGGIEDAAPAQPVFAARDQGEPPSNPADRVDEDVGWSMPAPDAPLPPTPPAAPGGAQDPFAVTPAADDPFAMPPAEPAADPFASAPSAREADPFGGGAADPFAAPSEMPVASPVPEAEPEPEPTPVVAPQADPFESTPEPAAEPAPAPSDGIVTADASSAPIAETPAPEVAVEEPVPVAPEVSEEIAAVEPVVVDPPVAEPAAEAPVEPEPTPPPAPAPPPAPSGGLAAQWADGEQPAAPAPPPEPPKPAPAPSAAEAPSAPSGGDGAFIAAFEEAAGMRPGSVQGRTDTELAAELGRLMKAMAENLQGMLLARAETKGAMRSSERTMIGALENNPLKFSPTPEDALKIMFGEPSRSYLDAEKTMAESFGDLQRHQMQTFGAMQEALQALIEDMSPDRIEADTAEDGGLARLVGSRRAKYWDTYSERFKAKANRHERGMIDAFMVLFAEMYDRQGRG